MTRVVIGIIVMSVVAVATLRLLLAARGDDGGGRSPAVWAAVIGVIGGVVVVVVGVAATAHDSLRCSSSRAGSPTSCHGCSCPLSRPPSSGSGSPFEDRRNGCSVPL